MHDEKQCPPDITINGVRYIREAPAGPRVLSVGQKVLIRTVTCYQTGRITHIDDAVVELADAAWIADVGRFSDALASGVLREVEPFAGPVAVSRGSIVDATVWAHELPRTRKP